MKPSANRLAAIDLMLRTGDLVRRNTSAAFEDGTLTDVEVNRSLDIIEKHKAQIAAIENELMNGPTSVKTANGGTFIKRMAM